MTSAVQHRSTPSRSEQAARRAVVDRLAAQFPELTRDDILQAVNGHYAGFEGSRVRDFVPVLVERAARAEIATAKRHRA